MEQAADKDSAEERHKEAIAAWHQQRPEPGDRTDDDPEYGKELAAWMARAPPKQPSPKKPRTEESPPAGQTLG